MFTARVYALLVSAVLVPTLVTSTPSTATAQAAADSATKKTAADTTHAARKHQGLLGKARSAASVVQQKVPVSKEQAAQAAVLVATKANPAALTAQQVMQMKAQSEAQGAAAVGAAGQALGQAKLSNALATMGQTAAPATQLEGMRAAQLASGAGMVPGLAATDLESARLQAEYVQLVTRASSGDRAAANQLIRFQQEMTAAALRMQTLAPAQQQTAYSAALRAALVCAVEGHGCTATGK